LFDVVFLAGFGRVDASPFMSNIETLRHRQLVGLPD
jgi:hypothetical protein